MSDKAISTRIKTEEVHSISDAERDIRNGSNPLIDIDTNTINIQDNNSIINTYIESSAKNINIIFENFENISRNFDEKKGIVNHLKDVRYNLNVFLGKFEMFQEEANQSITSVEQIISNYKLLYNPLKNILSNLSLLKELFSSINLTNNNYGQNIKGFSSEESLRIEKIMTKVAAAIPLFKENIYNMEKHSGNLKNDIADLNEVMVQKVHRSLERAINLVDSIIEYYNNDNIQKIGYDNLLKKCTKINSQIADELHSISKQINTDTNNTAINGNSHKGETNGKELNGHEMINNALENNFVIKKDNTGANNSLIETCHRVSEMLSEFGNLIFEISHLNKFLSGQRNSEDIEKVRNANEGISEIMTQISNYCEKETFIKEEIFKIIRVSKELYDRFLDLDMMDNNIEQTIIKKIISEEFLTNPEESIATQAQQILKIYADNHFEKSSFKNVFESTIEELNSLKNINEENNKNFSYSLSFEELLGKLIKDFGCYKSIYSIIVEKSNKNGEVIAKTMSISKDALKFCRNLE